MDSRVRRTDSSQQAKNVCGDSHHSQVCSVISVRRCDHDTAVARGNGEGCEHWNESPGGLSRAHSGDLVCSFVLCQCHLFEPLKTCTLIVNRAGLVIGHRTQS